MSTPPRSGAPPLELVQQEAVAVEQSTNTNKKQVDVYVVIKNQPFTIYLKSTDTTRVNFNSTTVKAQLYYDCDPPKPVDYIQHEPLQYVVTPNSSGTEVGVEIKIGILSSQHQGSLFVVILRVADHSGAGVASNPIRIVSKIDHIRKEGVSIKKPTFNEIIMDRLVNLESQQEEQIKFLHQMIERQVGGATSLTPSPSQKDQPSPYSTPPLHSSGSPAIENTSPPSSPGSSTSTPSSTTTPLIITPPNNTPTLPSAVMSGKMPSMSLDSMSRSEVEALLARLLAAYANIDPEDRPSEIRKLVRTLGASLEAEIRNLERAFAPTSVSVKEEPGIDTQDATHKDPTSTITRTHQRTSSKGGTPITPLPPPSNNNNTMPPPPSATSKPKFPPSHLVNTPPKVIAFSPSKSTSAIPPLGNLPKFSISPSQIRKNTTDSVSSSSSSPSEVDSRSETIDPMEIGNYLSRSFPPSPAIGALPPAIQQQLSPLTAPLIPPQSIPQLISPPHSMELTPQSSQEIYSHQHEWPHFSQPVYPNPPLIHQPIHANDPETAYLLIHPQYRNQSPPPPQVSANIPYPPQNFIPNQPAPTAHLTQFQEMPYKPASNLQKVDTGVLQDKLPITQHSVKLEHLPTPSPQSPFSTPFVATPPTPSTSTPTPPTQTPPQSFFPPSYPTDSFLVQQLVLELSQKNLTDHQIQHQVALYIQHLQQQQHQHQQHLQQQQMQLQQVQQQIQLHQQHNATTPSQPSSLLQTPQHQQTQQSQQFEFVIQRGEPAGVTSSEYQDKWQF